MGKMPIDRLSCMGCKYRQPMSDKVPVLWSCQYILFTGKPRGCPAESCDKYEYALRKHRGDR